MDGHKPFKVVIVGGGVGGLTLANMFQKFGIDFVVLEAHHDITPTVGASIGLFPNGLRILDQIGCFEAVEAMANEHLVYLRTRDSAGKPISTLPQASGLKFTCRHGYPMLFFDRQWLLKALYGHLEDQSRILLRKKVRHIQHLADGVRITTEDGNTFEGSMAVGADGIHSAVRKELSRIAQGLPSSICPPGAFPPSQEDEIPCWYKCNFGTAENVDGWHGHEQSQVFGEGHSALIVSGPGSRVYWFIFVRLPAVKRGGSITRFTKEDEAQFAKEYAGLQLTETLTWGSMYEKRLNSVLTPLHEMVYNTWFQKRVILLGDSVHKPNPITGQGGNGAIESAAELINGLIQARDANPQGLAGLRDDDFARIFAQMQSARVKRARDAVDMAHEVQAFMASENPLRTKLVACAMAMLPSSHWSLQRFYVPIVAGARIKSLPVPPRPRAIPFDDERPAPPAKSTTAGVVRHVYAGALLAAAAVAWTATPTTGRAAHGAGLASLWQHAAPVLMYTLEGHRVGHRGSLLGAPGALAVGLHGLGIDRAIPSYALLHAFFAFATPPERHVPPPAAKSILQAFAWSGLAASAKYLLDRYQSIPSDPLSAVMKFSVLFPVLAWGLSRLRRADKETETSNREDYVGDRLPFSQYQTCDLAYLRALYLCAFGLQAVAHVASCVPLGIGQALLEAFGAAVQNPSGVPLSLRSLLSGQGLTSAVWVLQNLYAVWDLRSLGYIKTVGALKAAVGVAISQVLVGPGATWAALWCWRDEIFASSMIA